MIEVKLLLLILTLFLPLQSICQEEVDLVNVYWRPSPVNRTAASSEERFDFNLYGADFKLPIPLNKKKSHTLIFGSEYQHLSFTSESFGLSVNAWQFQLGYQYKKSGFKSLFMVLPKIAATSFSEDNAPYLQFGALSLSTKNRSPSFSWKFGAYYNTEFFGSMFVPLFGFDWRINERHRLKVVVPVDAEYTYALGEKIRMGLRFQGVNASYRIQEDLYLDRADNNIWLFGEWYVTKNIVFHAKAGHSVLRKYKIYQNDRRMGLKLGPINILDDRGPSEPLFKEGWSFELRLLVRIRVSEDD